MTISCLPTLDTLWAIFPDGQPAPRRAAARTDGAPEVGEEGASVDRLPAAGDIRPLLQGHQARPGQQHVQPQPIHVLVQRRVQTTDGLPVLSRQTVLRAEEWGICRSQVSGRWSDACADYVQFRGKCNRLFPNHLV